MSDRYFGKYPGTVFSVDDPKQLGRIKALVPEVGFIDEPTDWCFPSMPLMFGVPDVGQNVFVEFMSGDVNRPVWTGVFYSYPQGESEIAKTAKGEKDIDADGKNVDVAVTEEGLEFQESPSPMSSQYPKNRVFRTASGHLLEFDDTPGQERVQIFHASGSYIEMKRDGTMTVKTVGKLHEITNATRIMHVLNTFFQILENGWDMTIRGLWKIAGKDLEAKFTGKVKVEIPGLTIEAGEQGATITHDGTNNEKIGGSKTVSVAGSLNEVIGSGKDVSVIGTSNEQVGNVLGSTVAKKIQILLGHFHTLVNAGNIKSQSLVGNVELSTLVGQALLLSTSGEAKVACTAGPVKIEALAGNVYHDGVLVINNGGSLPVARKTDLTLSDSSIDAAWWQFVDALVQFCLNHTHPAILSGPDPQGGTVTVSGVTDVSAVPITSPNPTKSYSKINMGNATVLA